MIDPNEQAADRWLAECEAAEARRDEFVRQNVDGEWIQNFVELPEDFYNELASIYWKYINGRYEITDHPLKLAMDAISYEVDLVMED